MTVNRHRQLVTSTRGLSLKERKWMISETNGIEPKAHRSRSNSEPTSATNAIVQKECHSKNDSELTSATNGIEPKARRSRNDCEPPTHQWHSTIGPSLKKRQWTDIGNQWLAPEECRSRKDNEPTSETNGIAPIKACCSRNNSKPTSATSD